MRIDNMDIKSFGAELLDKRIGTAEFISTYEWTKKAYKPLCLSKENKYAPIECDFVLKAITRQELEENTSNFLKKLEQCTLKFDDIDFYYNVFTQTQTKTNEYIGKDVTDDMEIQSIGVSFLSEYKYKDGITENLSRILTKTINVPGNLDTPAIVEITPSIDIIDLIITGLSDDPITIRNLKANIPVIINGEDGTVLENGVNKFGDTDMWEFPRLKSGANIITLSKDSCNVVIKYKPRWI